MRSLHRAFREYGEDIKEFQWLAYKYNVTGETTYPYSPELTPFINMGWLVRDGDVVSLEKDGKILLDELYEIPEKPVAKPRKRYTQQPDEVKEFLMEILVLPADFHINMKYTYQLSSLVGKFGGPLVLAVADWYNASRHELAREYQELRYEQFMSHGLFKALHQWMVEGVPKVNDDFRNRVC